MGGQHIGPLVAAGRPGGWCWLRQKQSIGRYCFSFRCAALHAIFLASTHAAQMGPGEEIANLPFSVFDLSNIAKALLSRKIVQNLIYDYCNKSKVCNSHYRA